MNLRTLSSAALFALVALLSFSVWAVGASWYSTEKGMYALCALVFLGLGGLALLPASGLRGGRAAVGLCLRFALGFAVYALVWSVSWFTFHDTFGEGIGSFFGLLGLTAILKRGTDSPHDLLTATAIVFLWHTLGYYIGGLAYQALQNRGVLAVELPLEKSTVPTVARFAWGLFYGLGLGFGLAKLLHSARRS